MTIVVSSPVQLPWADGAIVALGGIALPWNDGTLVVSDGGAFAPPAGPPGPDPSIPDSLPADYVLPAQASRTVVHDVSVIDLRDNSVVEFDSLDLSTDETAVVWTMSLTKSVNAQELFARMTAPGDPPVLQVSIDGQVWNFLIEGVARPREFGKTGVTLTGRSPTIIAAEPYSFPQNWVNDGPASAAQLVDQAQLYTGLEVRWHLRDWLVPDKVFSFSGAPLALAQRVAESVGGVIRSDRAESAITIEPRYRELANRWPYIAPDVEVFIDAVLVDNYQRADKPAFNAVYVSGQQQGVVGLVSLAGTPGDRLAPMVTDLLLTDVDAVSQRGEAILGAGGPQADVTLGLPVLTGGLLPGVFEVGWIVRVKGDGQTGALLPSEPPPHGDEVLLARDALVKYLLVDHSDVLDRSAPSFDDSAWAAGTGPFGNSGSPPVDHNTDIPKTAVLWVRVWLSLRAGDATLTLGADDVGWAYLDGVQVATVSSTGSVTVTFSVPSSGLHLLAFRQRDDTGSGPLVGTYLGYELTQPVAPNPPGPIWYGRVKAVAVAVRLPTVRQSVVLERHTDVIAGTVSGESEAPPYVLPAEFRFAEESGGNTFVLEDGTTPLETEEGP